MKIVSVIPLKKGIQKNDLTYFTGLDVSIGNIVSVPVRSKNVLALVTNTEELKEGKSNVKKMNFNLKKIIENKGDSIFLKEFFDAIFQTNKYFAQNKNNIITSIIPNIFIEGYDKLIKIKNNEKITNTPVNSKNLRSEKLLFQYETKERISVYKTLIRESFARGKSVFIVAPTQSDIEKFASQLSKGIEQFTFSMHSGISTKKNLLSYEKMMTSEHPVLIIGTPAFLSIPRGDVGTIILEHENSNTYRMQKKPYLDLRIFTEIYASKINARFIMADEILSFETIGRKEINNLNTLHPLSYRINFEGEIEIINPEKEDAVFKIFSKKNIEDIKNAVENKKNVFIFSLRKGLATMTVCRDCGDTLSCEKCGSPLVLYTSNKGEKRMFVCNRCEKKMEGDTVCKSCGSWNLMPLGIGADTVHEEIEINFPKEKSQHKIFKLDKVSAKTKSGAEKIIKEFEENPGSILIGTEMSFFYIKNKVPLSIIASFDSLWSIPNFKMSEKVIQIILAMISNTTEKLTIQTKNTNDGAILATKSGNLLSFVREELEDRKKLDYPPFKTFIKIKYLGDKTETAKARNFLEETFKEYEPEIFSGFVAQQKGKYVTNALIKTNPKKWSLLEISAGSSIDENLLNKLLSLPPPFEVFVDPEDLL